MTTDTAPINLNADLGEGMGQDAALLGVVQSANIACGGHAGDAASIGLAVRGALAHGVDIGAHPSFEDREGFGRRRMVLPHPAIRALVVRQIQTLAAVAHAEGGHLCHVKPHGALHNMACNDFALSRTIVSAILEASPHYALVLLAPCLSPLLQAGLDAGLPVVAEAYADRRYQDDGQLAPRQTPGAVLHQPEDCAAHVRAMLARQGLVTTQGHTLPTAIQSICVHGDNVQALASAQLVRDMLAQTGHRPAQLGALAMRHTQS